MTPAIRDKIKQSNTAIEPKDMARLSMEASQDILQLIREHSPEMAAQDVKSSAETIRGRSPKEEILTHIIGKLIGINKHLGLTGGGRSRGKDTKD